LKWKYIRPYRTRFQYRPLPRRLRCKYCYGTRYVVHVLDAWDEEGELLVGDVEKFLKSEDMELLKAYRKGYRVALGLTLCTYCFHKPYRIAVVYTNKEYEALISNKIELYYHDWSEHLPLTSILTLENAERMKSLDAKAKVEYLSKKVREHYKKKTVPRETVFRINLKPDEYVEVKAYVRTILLPRKFNKEDGKLRPIYDYEFRNINAVKV